MFSRAFKPGSPDHEAMKTCKSFNEKRAFKMAWMERLLAEVTVEKTHATKHSNTTLRVGSMIPFGKVVERYGVAYDEEKAIVLATRYCAKAMALGEGWVGVDSMAECPLF